MKLKDKVAVITGSSRGIGKATALLFAKEGAKVVINYRKEEEKAREVADQVEKLGSEAIAVRADISKPEDIKKLFQEAVKAFGTVDILVNNAGYVVMKEFFDLTAEDWREMLDMHLTGYFICSQEAAKIMKNRGGRILSISSIRGLENCGREGVMPYSAAKAGVINLTKTMAKELAKYNINVNAVAPGFTETDIAKQWTPEIKEKALRDTYLNRFVQPEEIAGALLYLASEDAKSVTGEVIVVDGGFQLK